MWGGCGRKSGRYQAVQRGKGITLSQMTRIILLWTNRNTVTKLCLIVNVPKIVNRKEMKQQEIKKRHQSLPYTVNVWVENKIETAPSPVAHWID